MSRYGDKCNVTACENRHDNIPHRFSKMLYCAHCAISINRANESYENEYGKIFKMEDIENAKQKGSGE